MDSFQHTLVYTTPSVDFQWILDSTWSFQNPFPPVVRAGQTSPGKGNGDQRDRLECFVCSLSLHRVIGQQEKEELFLGLWNLEERMARQRNPLSPFPV